MSWCSINELTTSAISFTANISENFRVNIYFTLSRDPNDVLTVSKVTQSIESAGGDAADEDIKRCRNFYNRVLCDETSGILSKSQISDVKSASDIKSLIQKVRSFISHYRKYTYYSSLNFLRYLDTFHTSGEYIPFDIECYIMVSIQKKCFSLI